MDLIICGYNNFIRKGKGVIRLLLTGRKRILWMLTGLLVFGKSAAGWSDRLMPDAVQAEPHTDGEVLEEPKEMDRMDRMMREYELLEEEEALAAAALLELETQQEEEYQAGVAGLQKELHEIRLKEQVLEARIMEAERASGKVFEEIFDK